MNPRQSVLIAMFLSLVVVIMANVQAKTITTQVKGLKQTA